MTQSANNTPLGQGIPARTNAAFHPSRKELMEDLASVEEACEKLSFMAGAEVFKMEQLRHKLLPDVDAFWVMSKVHRELTDALFRLRATYEAAGIIPQEIRRGGREWSQPGAPVTRRK